MVKQLKFQILKQKFLINVKYLTALNYLTSVQMEPSIFSTEINFTSILTSMKMITPSLQYATERSEDNHM